MNGNVRDGKRSKDVGKDRSSTEKSRDCARYTPTSQHTNFATHIPELFSLMAKENEA